MGLGWGDEGKGHIGSKIARESGVAAVMKVNGGSNAGHTITVEGKAVDTHQLPASGLLLPNVLNIIGRETVLNPIKLSEEYDDLARYMRGSLLINFNAHVLFPHHVLLDTENENAGTGNGSTKNGIAQAYTDKAARRGTTFEEVAMMSEDERIKTAQDKLLAVWDEIEKKDKEIIDSITDPEKKERTRIVSMNRIATGRDTAEVEAHQFSKAVTRFKPFMGSTNEVVHSLLEDDHIVLIEGAQSHYLGLDSGHGRYTTSSYTTAAHLAGYAGIPISEVRKIIGVMKLPISRVGQGPFPTESEDPILLNRLQGNPEDIDGEYGTSTGRKRRLGRPDFALAYTAALLNGITDVAVTKLDMIPGYGPDLMVAKRYWNPETGEHTKHVPDSIHQLAKMQPMFQLTPNWTEDLSQASSYGDFPKNAKAFVDDFEEVVEKPVTIVSAGPHPQNIHYRQPKLS